MTENADTGSVDAGIELLPADPVVQSEASPTGALDNQKVSAIRHRLSHRPSKGVLAGIVTVMVLTAGGIMYGTSVWNAQTQYRLSTVTNGTVTQSMTLSGSLAPISQAAVSFPSSGKVASVNVKAGQTVTAGQQLAALDTKSLRASVTTARKSLADARLNLHQLENGQANTTAASTTAANTTAASTTARSAEVSTRASAQQATPSSSGAGTSTAKLQHAITTTQKQIDQALAVAKIDLVAATAACSASTREAGPSESGPPSASPSTGGGESSTCAGAQEKVMQDQSQISQLQQQQSAQIDQLNKASQSAAFAPASGSASAGSQNETAEATGEQLAAAQAQIDAAEAGLTEAQQNLQAAAITAPISGTVLSVPFAKGDTTTSTDAIEISGSSQYQATVQVAVDKIGSVEVGQIASVLPSGSTAPPLDASVTSVGVAPTTSDDTVTYPVTLSIPGLHDELRSGVSANVEIITVSVNDAVSVPTSAVQSVGNFKIVDVLEAGTATSKRVTVGAVGPTYTQITDGLTTGDQIILANLDEAVPSSNNTFRIPSGAGGFGGGGVRPGAGG